MRILLSTVAPGTACEAQVRTLTMAPNGSNNDFRNRILGCSKQRASENTKPTLRMGGGECRGVLHPEEAQGPFIIDTWAGSKTGSCWPKTLQSDTGLTVVVNS